MINVILSGGNGTRLWPISRSLFPKQYIKFFNNKSLFQLTVERNLNFCHECLIVSNTEQFFVSLEQLDEINVKSYKYILEP
ncbi:sugar phosphate nucleotidyltransferase, partial [Campylobacter concisus]|uniref:sugar phosphate nucleotidyltransferase n=1 Tax=Campylobacter concisus TaxID=199 RepID=UPI0021560278